MQQYDLCEHDAGWIVGDHGFVSGKLSDQSCGSHSGTGGVVLHICQHGSHRTENGAGQDCRQPDQRMAHDIGYLKHGGSDSLGDKAAESVFTVAGNGKSDHVAAAADGRGAGGKTGKIQDDPQCGRADRKGQNYSHYDGDDDTHQKRLLFRSPVDNASKTGHETGDWRTRQKSSSAAKGDGDHRGQDDIQFCFTGDQMPEGNADESCDESSQRFTRTGKDHISVYKEGSSEELAGIAADDSGDGGGYRDKRAFPVFHGDADADARAGQGCGDLADLEDHIADGTADQGADLLQDRSDNQSCKQAVGHSTKAVDKDVGAHLFQSFHNLSSHKMMSAAELLGIQPTSETACLQSKFTIDFSDCKSLA